MWQQIVDVVLTTLLAVGALYLLVGVVVAYLLYKVLDTGRTRLSGCNFYTMWVLCTPPIWPLSLMLLVYLDKLGGH